MGGRVPRLLLITDRRAARRPLAEAVALAVRGGVTGVQVREPDLAAGDLLALVRSVLPAARAGGAVVVVNDRIDVAIAAGADGVHLRRTSLPPAEARRILGPGALVGVSTHEEAEVAAAFADGADYVVFGPVFPTPSKEGLLAPRGADEFRRVAAGAAGPVLALGGMDAVRAAGLGVRPPHGVAAIRAILGVDDPEAAARALAAAIGFERAEGFEDRGVRR
jgi:thiamine-phosphate pyrophosphorylase